MPPHAYDLRKFDAEKRKRFLDHFAKNGRLKHAAAFAGVTRQTVLKHRQDDPEFDEAVREAHAQFADKLLQHADKLCLDGAPQYSLDRNGNPVLTKTEYPIALIQMRLRHLFPEMREQQAIDLNVRGGVILAPATATSEEWEKLFGQAAQAALPPKEPKE